VVADAGPLHYLVLIERDKERREKNGRDHSEKDSPKNEKRVSKSLNLRGLFLIIELSPELILPFTSLLEFARKGSRTSSTTMNVKYSWKVDHSEHSIELVYVEGTKGAPFLFGERSEKRPIEISSFFLAAVPVTQALWTHVMGGGNNPSHFRGDRKPVENVSWHDVTGPNGFLARINASNVIINFEALVKSAFDCLRKRNGNMRLRAGRTGLRDSSLAAATISNRWRGMTGTVAGRVRRVFGREDLVPITSSARKLMRLGSKRRTGWAFTTCPEMCGSGAMTLL
jgi:hypothetical protein